MQSFPFTITIATGTTNPNILSGQPIQYWGKAGVLTVYGNGDAAGLLASMNTNDGQDNKQVIPNGASLGAASTAGKVKTNEDFLGQFAIPAGVQLSMSVTNPTLANINANLLFVIT
jgi:hypothetical protein